MIGSIQMEKPKQDSPDYYLSFYNMYNLLQINDAIIFGVFDEAVEMNQISTEELLSRTNPDNYAFELIGYFRVLGVRPPKNIIEMCNEERGIDTSFAYKLQENHIDPFKWFRNTNEFVQLYAIFEQAIKEFLELDRINEKDVIEKLIERLKADILCDEFLRILNFKTFGLIETDAEMKAIWDFYTKVRHCISHSGGRITKKVIDSFNEIKSKYRNTIQLIENRDWLRQFFLLRESDDYTLFKCSYSIGDMLYLDQKSLNFFRMFCVFIVETLNKLHPSPTSGHTDQK